MDIKTRLAIAQKSGIASAGKTNLIKHLQGERLTQRQAIHAKCCDCMGYNADGRMDCRMPHCSLYPWMSFRDDRAERKRADLARRSGPTGP